jgi:hypothetical protein
LPGKEKNNRQDARTMTNDKRKMKKDEIKK